MPGIQPSALDLAFLLRSLRQAEPTCPCAFGHCGAWQSLLFSGLEWCPLCSAAARRLCLFSGAHLLLCELFLLWHLYPRLSV